MKTWRAAAIYIADTVYDLLSRIGEKGEPTVNEGEDLVCRLIDEVYVCSSDEVRSAITFGILLAVRSIFQGLPEVVQAGYQKDPELVRDYIVLRIAAIVADSTKRGALETNGSLALRPLN